MTRLINIDNGGTLTDICVVDGDDVRYTKTLTTPFDLSRCLFDGLAKASTASLRAGEAGRAAAVDGLHPLLHHAGDECPGAAQGSAARPADDGSHAGGGARRRPARRRTCFRRSSVIATRSSMWASTTTRSRPNLSRGSTRWLPAARAGWWWRLAVMTAPSRRSGSSATYCGFIPASCWARFRCCSPGSWWPTGTTRDAPGRPCSTRSSTRRWNGSCSTRRAACARAGRAVRC